MATTVDTLLVRIEADMSDLKKSLDKVQRDVDKSSKGITGAFRKIGTAMKTAVAAVLVREAVRGGTAMINLASDIEEMQGKSKVVFGQFRDQVVADLEAFGDAVGRSTFELEGMASSIQDTFVPMGFARGAAADLSVELTKLAVDVASFNNASDTETMAAFQSALVGNHETVRRFGVVITQATLDQELMRMGIEKGTKAATEAQKVQARLNLITQGTADAHGDAARTADSFANRSRALKADLNELAGELGTILLPAVTQIVEQLLAGATAARGFLQDIGVLARYGSNVDGLREQVEDLREEFNALADEAGIPEDQRDMEIFGNSLVAMKQRLLRTQEAALLAAEALEAVNAPPPVDTPDADTADGVDQTAADAAEELKTKLKEQRRELAANSSEMLISAANQRVLDEAIRSGNEALERSTRENIILNELVKKFPELAKENISLLQKEAAARANVVMNENAHAAALDIVKQAQDNYQASVQGGLDYVLSNIRTNQELEETLKDLTAARQSQTISELEYIEAQKQIEEKIRELDPVYQNMKDRAQQVYDDMSNALTEMVMSGQVNLNNLGKMFKQTINQMIADAVRAKVIKPMLNSAFSMAGGFLGKSGNPLLALAGTALGAIGGSADGGNLNAYTPQIVGERGPELIVPKTASTIKNKHNTMNALGGGGGTIVNQTINVSAGVSQTVKTEMMALLPRFKQDTMAAVVDAKRRGGSFGQAFG